MKKKLSLIISGVLILSLLLAGCGEKGLENKEEAKNERIESLEEELSELKEELNILKSDQGDNALGGLSNSLLISGAQVIELIKERDMEGLEQYVHPSKGVRFTAYPNINLAEDQVFQADELAGVLESPEIYIWGDYDGSGDPIEFNFSDYYDQFIYDVDFANPHQIGNNVILGEGNLIDNVAEAYSGASFLEFYFSGFNSEYEGMDWKSLKLVFEEEEGLWYLVGVVHGQWTT